MRAVIQRVRSASVAVDGTVVGDIGEGLLVLLGVRQDDGLSDAAYVADKIVNLRIMRDGEGRMNRSVMETGGAVLIVSQFTLYGDARKGRRPSYTDAAPGESASALYEQVCEGVGAAGVCTARGVFGAMMDVALVNDGPVTILLDSRKGF